MSKEYIERSIIHKMISDTDWYHIGHNSLMIGAKSEEEAIYQASDVISAIENAPTADVAPVVHGRWYDEDSFDAHGSPIYRCSICNKTVADNYISCHKFCLHCGAHMDRGGNL